MLHRLAALRMLRLLRVWVACAALSLLPAPSAAPVLASDVVTVQASLETTDDEQAPSAAAAEAVRCAASHAYVASRKPTFRPVRTLATAPQGALYLRHCSLLL
jgi:hypothetical protein